MRLGHYLNEHILARFDFRLLRNSDLQRLMRDKARLRKSLARTQKQFRKSLARTEEQAKRIDKLESHLKQRQTSGSQAEFLQLARHFKPLAVVGHRKIRLGRDCDGGYVMLDDFEAIDAAFSFGVGHDASWDLDVADRGISVYQFDHTVPSGPAEHPNLHFFRSKIVPQLHADGETIAQLLRRYAKGFHCRCLLKMDIEGDEWPVLEHVELGQLQRFAQIICEFHNFSRASDPGWCAIAIAAMDKLSKSFQVIHVHGNNHMPFICVGNVPFPEVLEVTLANRERYQFEDINEEFPTPLDRANLPGRADLFLGSFKF